LPVVEVSKKVEVSNSASPIGVTGIDSGAAVGTKAKEGVTGGAGNDDTATASSGHDVPQPLQSTSALLGDSGCSANCCEGMGGMLSCIEGASRTMTATLALLTLALLLDRSLPSAELAT